jgi:hypothetical protein
MKLYDCEDTNKNSNFKKLKLEFRGRGVCNPSYSGSRDREVM